MRISPLTIALIFATALSAQTPQCSPAAAIEQIKRGTVELPGPDGNPVTFRVTPYDMMEEGLRKIFPEFNTYNLANDALRLRGKLDVTAYGIHAMICTPSGHYFVDPDDKGFRTAQSASKPLQTNCYVVETPDATTALKAASAAAPCVGSQLRTYKLAVACTGEYAAAATGNASPSVAQAVSRIITTVNRVNGIFETEAAIRLVLVSTETAVVFTSAASDPFTANFNPNSLINESQTVLDTYIGSANYDIGHTFSTGGGLAQIGCACLAGDKGKGVSGLANPTGDPFDVDYVAHEIGHQLNAHHTYNSLTGNCSYARYGPTAAEPGSGVTIMAYAGQCAPNNLTTGNIAYLHALSYDEIVTFAHSGGGTACGGVVSTGNQPPTVSAPSGYIVPHSTAFRLTASASDPNNDPLTYSWEEVDVASAASNWNAGTAPFFRSFPPTASPSREFPSASVQLSGGYTTTPGEFVPNGPTNLWFRATVRDNNSNGGGVCHTTTSVSVTGAGPFRVTYPDNTGIVWGTGTQSVIWDVNGTHAPPVACDSVRILISIDGGGTYNTLVGSAPNVGSRVVTVPTLSATSNTCRVKVVSRNGVFFDVSNNNFTISVTTTTSTPPPPPPPPPPPVAAAEQSLRVLQLMPNPASEELFILSDAAPDINTMNVYDLSGKSVTSLVRMTESARMNISALPEGIYFVALTINNVVYRSRFILLRH